MSEPLVSIIIPCYNGAAFVAEAIESALRQTYPHKEVIVVDDGSTDDSRGVIGSFGNSVRLLSRENGGVAAARNSGAAAARGELLQFLDQDDLLYPEKLSQQVPLAIAHRPGMVFCDADVVSYETNEPRGHWGTGSVSTEDPVAHVLGTVLVTAGALHWRETFERVGGFRAHTPPCEDRDLHLRMACAGVAFHHSPERLFVWRRVDGSQSARDPERGLQVLREIGEDAWRELEGGEEMTGVRRAAFAAFFAGIGRRAYRLGLDESARECFARAREIHPDGGFSQVYSKAVRAMVRVIGPRMTERVVRWKRVVCGDIPQAGGSFE